MARLNAIWNNFNLRGQTWDHFWQDAKVASTGSNLNGSATISFSTSTTISSIGILSGNTTITLSQSGNIKGSGFLNGGSTITVNGTSNILGSGLLTASPIITIGAVGISQALARINGATGVVISAHGNITSSGGAVQGRSSNSINNVNVNTIR